MAKDQFFGEFDDYLIPPKYSKNQPILEFDSRDKLMEINQFIT